MGDEHDVSELALALRRFRRRPGRTLAAALTLAIGIGAITAALAVVDRILLRDLPVRDQDALVVAWQISEQTPLRIPFGGVTYDAVRRGATALEAVSGYSAWGTFPALVEGGGSSYALAVTGVAGDFFGVLGSSPHRGRLLGATDDVPGAGPVAVLSHRAWRTRYGADPSVVGATLTVGGVSTTIVGVAPRSLDFPRGTDLWRPLRADYTVTEGPGPELHLLGRARVGSTPADVVTDIRRTLARDERVPESTFVSGAAVREFEEAVLGPVRPLLRAGVVAALVLLLAAAANATLLLLSGGRAAAHDVAVRRALGAPRSGILRRFLSDALLVGVLAFMGALVVTWFAVAGLAPVTLPNLPRFDQVRVDGGVVFMAFAIATTLTVALGAVSGSLVARLDTLRWLSLGGRGQISGRSRFRSSVAGLQVGLTVVGAVAAGLLIRTVHALDRLDPGHAVADVTVVSLSTPYTWFNVPATYLDAITEVVADLENHPGVQAVRPSLSAPLQQGLEVPLRTPSQSAEAARSNPYVAVDAVLPDHSRALGIPLLAGRGLSAADNRPEATPVVVVDEVLARSLWPGEDPVGKGVVGYPGRPETVFSVVGVVAATRYRELLEPHPRAYFPLQLLGNSPPAVLLVRSVGLTPGAVRTLVADAFRGPDPRVQVLAARPMDELLREPTVGTRLAASILVWFALATLLLAALGIYGVFTVTIQERVQEMGIRQVLGAGRADIVRLVLVGVLRVALIGGAVGIATALWASRLVRAVLYEVRPNDPLTFLVVGLGSIGLALVAGLIPALRASSAEPSACLRSE